MSGLRIVSPGALTLVQDLGERTSLTTTHDRRPMGGSDLTHRARVSPPSGRVRRQPRVVHVSYGPKPTA